MKKIKSILSLFLAGLMLLSAFPLGVFATDAVDDDGKMAVAWTNEDYDALYVHDADGDGKDDLKFQWDAFDMKEGDPAPVGFVNAVDGAVYKRTDNTDIVATPKNGYLLTNSDFKLSNVFRGFAKNVTYEGANVRVLQDSTWEMVIFQNTDITYEGTKESPSTVYTASIAPANKLSLKSFNDGTVGSSFIGATYGVLAPIDGTSDVQIRVDTQADKSFATVFGNPRGQAHTFTVAIRHDYTIPDGAIEGTLKLDFLRDSQTQDRASFKAAYDARYKGNYKAASTPAASDDMFTFGGMDFAYRAMRVYDVALTEAQLQQNHAVDLLKYYKIDLSSIDFDNSALLKNLYESLNSINLGDLGAKESVLAVIEEIFSAQSEGFDYDALYVHDADGDGDDDLKFRWDAFDMKEGDKAPVGFVNAMDGAVYKRSDNSNIVATAKDGYLLTKSDLKFSNVFRAMAKSVSYEGASVSVLQDSTWEMVIFQNTDEIYEGSKDNPPTAYTANIAPANKLNLKRYNDGVPNSSFIGATYGVLAPVTGTDNVQIRVDTQADNSFATVFGNQRGADHTFTVAIRHDYTVPEGRIEGTLKLDFLRDSKTQNKASFNAAYDARYKGNYKNTSTPEAADNMFTFGGMDWGYRAMRIYDVALSEEQLQQNHAVDLFKYYKIDVSDIDFENPNMKSVLQAIYSALASINLGDANAQASIEAILEESLQNMDLIAAGGAEATAILASDAILFDGYSLRLWGNPGLRAVFTLNREFVEAAEANTTAKIKEIGAIAAIKGDYELADLTVAGGAQMIKRAIYANGEFTVNGAGTEQTYAKNGKTYFAMETLFDSEEVKTAERYQTELLYRGYMIVTVQDTDYVLYTDMTAPSFSTISMFSVSEVFASRGWEYEEVKTIHTVLDTCHASHEKKNYAADSFLKADGSLDTESEGDLNVVFIGGSLTESVGTKAGEKKWTESVADYLQELFPNKKVNHINSGVGGTNSEGAAARFCEHVAPYEPDIIFIDFTVNDDMNNFDEARAQYRLENFLYQCSQLEKIPTVVYLHTPPATMPNSAVYNEWYEQVEYKEEWAAHYGISTINIYDYSYAKFEKEKAEGGESDYIKWLDTYYGTLQDEEVGVNSKYGRYDVHGGYQLYLEAIVAALESNAEEILTPYRFASYLHPEKIDEIERTYVKHSHADEMFTYSDGWMVYTKSDEIQRTTGDLRIPLGRWEYPFLVDGVHEAPEGESVTFTTDADSLTLYYMAVCSPTGGNFEVYVGEQLIATLKGHSSSIQPFFSNTVELNNDAHEELAVTIKVVHGQATAEKAYVRFTSVYFGYNQ